MFKFLNIRRVTSNASNIEAVAKEQLEKNRAVLESLKAYDEGKKDISTTNVRTHLRDLQPTP